VLAALRQTARDMLGLVVPPMCSVCGDMVDAPGLLGAICRDCRGTLQPCGRGVCPVCGYPVALKRGRRCPHCPPRPVYFESARSALLYHGALLDAFYAFKYHGHDELGVPLARIMFEEIGWFAKEPPARAVLTPVPLHYLRRWQRGYNQSAILATEFGRLAGVPTLDGALARIRHTPRQALQPRNRRGENVRGAFEVGDRSAVRGAHIGLVDDLLTSGHTVNACARTLMEGGAASVRVLTLARA